VRFDGVVALDGVSLTVRANQIVGVIGRTARARRRCSRSLTIRDAGHGTITYKGQSLLGLPTWRLAHMGIARTLQGLGLWPTLTVLENVVAGSPSRTRLAPDLLALPGADRRIAALREEALANLGELGVADRAGAYPGALPQVSRSGSSSPAL